MAGQVVTSPEVVRYDSARPMYGVDALRYAVPIGRALFSCIFLLSALGNFTSQAIDYATSRGVPMASTLVPLSGVLLLLGGLSVALGFKTRIGAALLALTLIPVTFMMHRFWLETDTQVRMIEQIMFLKNLSMLGGAILLFYFGSGPISIDERAEFREEGGFGR